MEINGKITILIDREYTRIKVTDDDSSITFLEIILTPEQLSSALSRLAYTKCEKVEVHNLENIGKIRENRTFEFVIPGHLQDLFANERDTRLGKYAQELLDQENEGWIASSYFSSQDSFFWKGDIKYARCLAIRYIEKKV